MSRFGERRRPEEGRLEYIQASNYDFRSDSDHASELKQLVVWGGLVANCAEDDLSRLVDAAAPNLEQVTYCPDRTKGGVLIRPKYHQGDRGGEVLFPMLTDMTIRLWPVLLPTRCGWLMPGLRRLRLLVDTNGPRSIDKDALRGALDDWLGLRMRGGSTLPELLSKACPELESITVTLGSTLDKTQQQTDWFVLQPPKLVQWEVHRLLLLPILGRGAASGLESSPLGCLTLPLLELVLSFLGRRHWEYQTHKLPCEVIETHQLSPELCNLEPSVLLEHELDILLEHESDISA